MWYSFHLYKLFNDVIAFRFPLAKNVQHNSHMHNFTLFTPTEVTSTRMQIELEGSPLQVVVQPPGVKLAVNCGGPAYQASNDVVYTSEFTQFLNTDPDFMHGNSISFDKHWL